MSENHKTPACDEATSERLGHDLWARIKAFGGRVEQCEIFLHQPSPFGFSYS